MCAMETNIPSVPQLESFCAIEERGRKRKKMGMGKKRERKGKKGKPTTPTVIPRRSPIQVVSGPTLLNFSDWTRTVFSMVWS